MKLVVLDMSWGVTMGINKAEYYVSEYVAISLDENIYTTGMLHYINEKDESSLSQKNLRYGEGGFIVDNQQSGWRRFWEFVPKGAIVVFWNPDMAKAIKGCNEAIQRPFYTSQVSCLKDIYGYMTSNADRMEPLTLSVAMDELNLTLDQGELKEPRVRCKAIVRLLRKLINAGIRVKGQEFINCFRYASRGELMGHKFFDLNMKLHDRKRCELVKDCLSERYNNYDFDGTYVTVSLPCAAYKVNIIRKQTAIVYRRYDFSKAERRRAVNIHPEDIAGTINTISGAIQLIEEELSYGVGNSEITRLLQIIAQI